MVVVTEHSKEALLVQSTVMSVNVVFIKIDWKKSRHSNRKSLTNNMLTLGRTIAGVVRNMKPAMICMSEVGEANNPLTEEHMQQVEEETMQAWRDAATELVELHNMFQVGAPYMTVYDVGQVQCSGHRILKDLRLHQRTVNAQRIVSRSASQRWHDAGAQVTLALASSARTVFAQGCRE